MMKICNDHLQYTGMEIKQQIEKDSSQEECERVLFPTHPKLQGSSEIKAKWNKVTEQIEKTYTIK